jgi:hypothetical protein
MAFAEDLKSFFKHLPLLGLTKQLWGVKLSNLLTTSAGGN